MNDMLFVRAEADSLAAAMFTAPLFFLPVTCPHCGNVHNHAVCACDDAKLRTLTCGKCRTAFVVRIELHAKIDVFTLKPVQGGQ